jgi:hypothetical protein
MSRVAGVPVRVTLALEPSGTGGGVDMVVVVLVLAMVSNFWLLVE